MARIVVGSPNLIQPLLIYPDLGPAMLEQFSGTLRPFKKRKQEKLDKQFSGTLRPYLTGAKPPGCLASYLHHMDQQKLQVWPQVDALSNYLCQDKNNNPYQDIFPSPE
jgi:hypothetical protein